MEKEINIREFIAKNVATLLKNGYVVDLGVGMPTLATNYLPDGVTVFIQAENGILGCGPKAEEDEIDPDLIDAGAANIVCLPGGCTFDSAISFGIIRGGHLDATVLGALQVDEKGNLANWYLPGKMLPGPGGAMDLVAGAKKVIIAMEHTTKHGDPKVLKECTLPLTSNGTVDTIVTDLAILERTPEGLRIAAIAPHTTLDYLLQHTGCDLIYDDPDSIPLMIA
ncbi:MAG TPA: 3-oxoacid CoA-transferase subunit B [Chloroflexi bacterium]|nr:3-oxoacid CoA-transferase subunit B [Chloroflexota bacterium]